MTALSTMPFLGNMVTLTLRRDIPIVIVYRIQREMGTAMGTAISCIFHRERSKISFGIGAQRYIVLWVYIFGKYTVLVEHSYLTFNSIFEDSYKPAI